MYKDRYTQEQRENKTQNPQHKKKNRKFKMASAAWKHCSKSTTFSVPLFKFKYYIPRTYVSDASQRILNVSRFSRMNFFHDKTWRDNITNKTMDFILWHKKEARIH